LADPNDGGALELHLFEGTPQNVREGLLRNTATGRWYPIHEGIPSLFVDELRESYDGFLKRNREKLQSMDIATEAAEAAVPGEAAVPDDRDFNKIDAERRARDVQAEHYDRMLSLKVYEYIEAPAYRKALGDDVTSPLFEAGCGTGRFTGLFASMASEVVAIDMSRDSIVRNRNRHLGKTAAPVHYVQADLTHLPLRSDAFGRIAHCGVYEHIPSRELRAQFLDHARRVATKDATLLLSAYRYGGITRFFGKEGEHDGGIPFTRFTEEELKAEVEPYFEITQFRPNLGVYMSMLAARPRS
jgi:ubiquinone/menaquinone biosynthesis C-methylase UbiE/uncharacterized protein YbaR (Trm112 family)